MGRPTDFFLSEENLLLSSQKSILMLTYENKKNFANPSKRLKDMTKNVMHAALEMVTKTTPFCLTAASERALI